MKGNVLVECPDKCKVCQFYYNARESHTGKFAGACRLLYGAEIYDKETRYDYCPIVPIHEENKIGTILRLIEEYAEETNVNKVEVKTSDKIIRFSCISREES